MAIIEINNQELKLAHIRAPLAGAIQVALGPQALAAITASHEAVAKLIRGDQAIYGVNTGFGKLAKARIALADLGQLQVNLVRSHAAGTGELLDIGTVRLIMLLKLASLAKGYSGIHPATARALMT